MVRLTVVDDMLTICFASPFLTVSMARKARTENDSGRTVNEDKTAILLVYCTHYHMEDFSRQNTRARFFDQTFGSKLLHPIDFHMVVLTMVGKRLTRCVGSTATGVLLLDGAWT